MSVPARHAWPKAPQRLPARAGLWALAFGLALALWPAAPGAQEGEGIRLDLDLEELLREEGAEGATPAPGADLSVPLESVIGGAGGERVITAPGAVLRGLDKVAGAAVDMPLAAGQSADLGRLRVTLHECRHPEGEAAAEAFARLSVHDATGAALFEGWMIASSPALNALDHARYDVWVLRCSSS